MAENMKKLFTIGILLTLSGCGNNQDSLVTHRQTSRIDNGVVATYAPSESSTEEYVNRVGKRVLLVSDRHSNNYNFSVLEESQPVFAVNTETHSVIISRGVLQQLKNEAELAAALALGIAKLDNASNIDKDAANLLSMAGYDPHAILELQQQYFYAANNNQAHWLQNIYPTPPTAGAITTNEVMLKKMPKGLLRGEDEYNKELNR